MLPEGRYNAKAKTWDLGETQSGRPQVAVEFEITDGQFAGQSRTWFGMFGQGQGKDGPYDLSKRTIESLRFCGWRGDDIADLTGLDTNTVQIVIKHEDYQGQTRDRVAFVNRCGGGLALKNRMDDGKRAALAAKLRGKCISIPKDLADSGETPLPPSDTNGFLDDDF